MGAGWFTVVPTLYPVGAGGVVGVVVGTGGFVGTRVFVGVAVGIGVDAGYVEDLNDFTDQINAAGADVIESSKEWGNISCTCSCSQKCLVCGEDQGYVCLDALCAQNFNSLVDNVCSWNVHI